MNLATVGFLYPGHAAEDDIPRLLGALSSIDYLRAEVVHTSVGEDAHREDALIDLGSPSRLREGAKGLIERGAATAVWTCTSGSFVFGWDGARRQAEELCRNAGMPASSTSLAFVDAVRALGVRTVAVAATYPEPVTQRFVEFLTDGGLEVASSSSRGIVTAVEVGNVQRDPVLSLATEADHPEAQAILIPDTALHTAAWLHDLEVETGKPVLTANQVSVWQALRLAGVTAWAFGLGRLFSLPAMTS